MHIDLIEECRSLSQEMSLQENGLLALADFSKFIDLEPARADGYTRRAEVLVSGSLITVVVFFLLVLVSNNAVNL